MNFLLYCTSLANAYYSILQCTGLAYAYYTILLMNLLYIGLSKYYIWYNIGAISINIIKVPENWALHRVKI